MKTAFVAILLVSLIGIINGISYPSCSNSLSCDANRCCRACKGGAVLSSESQWGSEPILATQSGTCIPGRAQKGEPCDGVCQCDSGLKCYRQMSGVCCPPHLCYDEQWVKEQEEYWANCSKDPTCAFPAK